LTWTKIIQRWK